MVNEITTLDFWFYISIMLLYAETHYSFRGIYSRLKKPVPEILADLPHRLDPDVRMPVLILVKDADRYPITLDGITIILACEKKQTSFHVDTNSLKIEESMWCQKLEVEPPPDFRGRVCTVDVLITASAKGRSFRVKNDNYVGTGKAPFEIYLSETELPQKNGWTFGEFHCHTSYTSDQVEFGAPPDATAHLAKAMGLTFFCATDHSYDLDDDPGDYLRKDPELRKWRDFKEEIDQFNRTHSDFVIVAGEEVSVGNTCERNVHFLILNCPEFLPGDGDGAEKWLRTKPELSIADVLNKLNGEAVAFAAHPAVTPPWLQRVLVRRGKWQMQDCYHDGLHGLQIWNGTHQGLDAGKKMWVDLLLSGKRIYISGGNDAHGNFNRFRQIGFPFLTMRESHAHLFGKVRTGIFLDEPLSLEAVLRAVKSGNMLMTNGPFVEMTATNELGEKALIGQTLLGDTFDLTLDCRSSAEFGALKELRIFLGDLKTKTETVLQKVSRFANEFHHLETISHTTTGCYVRAELESERAGETLQCFTNPIWLISNQDSD